MTRKLNHKYSLSVVAPFIAILILMIAAGVLAQTSGTGQTAAQHAVLSTQQDDSAPAQALHRQRLPGVANSQRAPEIRSQKNKPDAGPLDENSPLFMPAVVYSSGGCEPRSIAVADLIGDGKLDLAVANPLPSPYCGSGAPLVGILLGNGDGTFQAPQSISIGAEAVALADLNGDGKSPTWWWPAED